MSDVHVCIEVTETRSPSAFSKALKELQELDNDFPDWSAGHRWWHKPPANARSLLARTLSRHGCTGRLSVEEKDEEDTPKPRWTGFTATTL